tara:strand:+ start:152 stop:883 length:732 start_codon:yes stop_codon:yes gene_type:complete
MLKLLIYSVFITITIPAISVFAETNSIPTYKAVYDIRYKGKLVGESEITLVEGQTHGSYIYASKSNTKGLLRLIAPKELLEKSEFSYNNNLIKPTRYTLENNSRLGDDSYSVDFNWEKKIAITTVSDQTTESMLVPGTLDRGTLQVAVMLEMQKSAPLTHTIRDDDGIRTYDYSSSGQETIETPLGLIQAEKLIRQREGYSRQTIFWLAKDFQHLPVRMEQLRNNEPGAVLEIRSIEWLTPKE